MFQLAYFQMVGAGKARNQDALFDGTAVRQVRLHKTRRHRTRNHNQTPHRRILITGTTMVMGTV